MADSKGTGDTSPHSSASLVNSDDQYVETVVRKKVTRRKLERITTTVTESKIAQKETFNPPKPKRPLSDICHRPPVILRPLPPPPTYVLANSLFFPGYTSWTELIVHAVLVVVVLCAAGFLLWANFTTALRASWATTIPLYYASVTNNGQNPQNFQEAQFNDLFCKVMGLPSHRVSSSMRDALWLLLYRNSIAEIVNASNALQVSSMVFLQRSLERAPSGSVASLPPNSYLSPENLFGQQDVPTGDTGGWENWPIVLGADSLTAGG